MKVRHIKRRNHPVYELKLVVPDWTPGPEWEHDGRGNYFQFGVNLAEFRPVPVFEFERVRKTWSRPVHSPPAASERLAEPGRRSGPDLG